MAETLSPNYGWTKPDPGASANTWGATLNATTDKIDTQVYVNQQGMSPIGAVTMFAGATAPTNWLICDGRSLSTAAPYDKLFAVLQYAFGGSGANFNLPNLVQNFPLGAGPNPVGAKGGAFSVPIAVGNLPPHAHPASQDAHAHTVAQSPHAHNIVTGSHSHGIVTGSHAHTIPDNLVRGSGSGLTNGGASFSLNGGGVTNTVGNLGGNTDTAGNLGGNTDAQNANIGNTDTRTPNVYIGNTGSGTPLSVVPPFVALNFIVRFQ